MQTDRPFKTIYCDHNFLINTERETAEYKRRLGELSHQKNLQLVVSVWHWGEMAADSDFERAVQLADYVDSLQPLWIRERRTLQANEVAAELFNFMNVCFDRPAPLTTLSEILVDLIGQQAKRVLGFKSRHFLHGMRTDARLQMAFRDKTLIQEDLLRVHKNRQFTRPLNRRADRQYVKGLLPDRTPEGVPIGRQVKRRFLSSFDETTCPAVAVEIALLKDGVEANRKLGSNEFRDRLHATALPYVDYIISDDKMFQKSMSRLKQALQFGTADVLSKYEFDGMFL